MNSQSFAFLRLCSRLTALWRYINFVLLFITYHVGYPFSSNGKPARHSGLVCMLARGGGCAFCINKLQPSVVVSQVQPEMNDLYGLYKKWSRLWELIAYASLCEKHYTLKRLTLVTILHCYTTYPTIPTRCRPQHPMHLYDWRFAFGHGPVYTCYKISVNFVFSWKLNRAFVREYSPFVSCWIKLLWKRRETRNSSTSLWATSKVWNQSCRPERCTWW